MQSMQMTFTFKVSHIKLVFLLDQLAELVYLVLELQFRCFTEDNVITLQRKNIPLKVNVLQFNFYFKEQFDILRNKLVCFLVES